MAMRDRFLPALLFSLAFIASVFAAEVMSSTSRSRASPSRRSSVSVGGNM